MKFRVLLVDDHAVIRAGLRALINAQADLEVIGEAKDGAEALEVACQTQPDVVLLDLSMPSHGGLPAIASIRKTCPHTQVLVLTMHNDPAYLRLVLAAGGAGYVVKTAADTEVLTAIHAVAQGRTFVDMSFGQHLAAAALDREQPGSGLVQERSLLLLSAREREVLDLVAHGHIPRAAYGQAAPEEPGRSCSVRIRERPVRSRKTRQTRIRHLFRTCLISSGFSRRSQANFRFSPLDLPP